MERATVFCTLHARPEFFFVFFFVGDFSFNISVHKEGRLDWLLSISHYQNQRGGQFPFFFFKACLERTALASSDLNRGKLENGRVCR